MQQLDNSILLWIQENLRCDFLTAVLKPITISGNGGFIFLAAVFFLLIFPKTRKIGMLCLCSLSLMLIVNNLILKNLINRQRPFVQITELVSLVSFPKDSSFPSGHSACAFAFAGTILFNCRKRFSIPALTFAFLMAFSRIYVGVHFLTDVIAGALTGFLLSFLVSRFYKKICCKEH